MNKALEDLDLMCRFLRLLGIVLLLVAVAVVFISLFASVIYGCVGILFLMADRVIWKAYLERYGIDAERRKWN